MSVINGTFDTDLSGWTYPTDGTVYWQTGKAVIYSDTYYCPHVTMEQTFIITAPVISFDYIGIPNGNTRTVWSLSAETTSLVSIEWIEGSGTRTFDVSAYIGKSATISFGLYSYGGPICYLGYSSLTIDNVTNIGGTPVLFSTFPTGATIIINGTEILPKTNVQINYPPGIYNYILRLPCNEDIIGQINVIVGPPINITGSFVLNTGNLSIISQPPGASVYYGAILQGQTPLSYTCYPEGTYNYNISLLGYQPFTGSTTVIRGLLAEVNATLVAIGPPGKGSLYISSTPAGASIYIDGILQTGLATPTTITGINVGSHTVALKLNGYYTIQFPVTVDENVTKNIYQILTPSSQTPLVGEGCISFEGTPQGAHIKLDGIDTGQVIPAIICGLSLGSHTYELSLTGYQTTTDSTTLVAGTGNNIPVNLVQSNICSWITSKGGISSLVAFDIMTLVSAYLLQTNLGFTVTTAHIMGAVAYYLNNLSSGNSLTGCSFT